MFKLSQISQYNIVKSAKENISKGLLTDNQKQKAAGAYLYLMRTDEGEELINSLLSAEEKKAGYLKVVGQNVIISGNRINQKKKTLFLKVSMIMILGLFRKK